MSQQQQAEDLQKKALQAESEIKALENTNYDLFMSDQRTAEAYEAEKKRLVARFEATDHLVTQAAKLNTIGDRVVGIGTSAAQIDADDVPDLVRPLGSVGNDSASDLNNALYDDLSKRIEALARLQTPLHHYDGREPAMLAHGSKERAWLNAYLRPDNNSLPEAQKVKQALLSNKEAMKALHEPRREHLLNPYVDRDGGYVTAEEFSNEMIKLRELTVGISSRVRTITTTASQVHFPTAQVVFNFEKREHTGQAPVTTLRLTKVFGRTTFHPHGRDIILKVPEELVEDVTFDLINFLGGEANRISNEEDELLIISGSGSGEALGYLTGLVRLFDKGATGVGIDPGTDGIPTFFEGDINVEFIQAFDTFIVPSSALTNAVWTGPRVFERRVRLFRTRPGGDESGDFLFKRALEAGAPNTLNSFPFLRSEFFPDNFTTGSVGDPLFHFGDLNDYWWIRRQGLRVRVLDQLYAETSEVGFKYDKREDGSLVRADGNIYARRQADAP